MNDTDDTWKYEGEVKEIEEIVEKKENFEEGEDEDEDGEITKKIETMEINKGWNDKNELLIASIGENAVSYKWLHEKSSSFYSTLNSILNITIIFVSTALSAQTFFPENSDDNMDSALSISKRIFIYISNVLIILISYLKFSEQIVKHNLASNNFSELYHDIQQKLCMYRRHRILATKYIKETLKKYDSLVINGPDINFIIINRFKKIFGDSDFALPNIADRIQKIDIITDTMYGDNGVSRQSITTSNMVKNMNKNEKIGGNLSALNNVNSLLIKGDTTDINIDNMTVKELHSIRNLSNIGITEKYQYEEERSRNTY